MEKEKRILFYFIGWFIVAICIFLVGVINAKADTYDSNQFEAQLYDNINGSLSSVTTYQESGASNYHYGYIGLTANSSGGAWGVSSPIPLIANHTYSMTVDPFVPGCGFTILSTYNRIGVGTSMSNAKTSYQNNTNVNEKFSKAISNSQFLQFVFTPTINASYIVFPYSTTSSCSSTTNQLSNIIIEDLGESGVSQDQINTSLTNQTNTLNQSITNSQNAITNNSDNNKDLIIQNQNENTNNQIISEGNIARQQETNNCSNAYMFNLKIGYTISSSNTLVSNNNAYYTEEYIPIHSNSKQLTIKNSVRTNGFYILVYNSSKTLLDYWYSEDGRIVNLPSGTSYFRVSSTNANVMIYDGDSGCINRIGETNDKLDQTNDKLDNLTGAITDDSSPNIDGLGDSAGWLPPGPLDSVLNLPLSLFNSLTTNLNKSCSPINVPLPYVNKNLTIPCINTLYEKIGISTFITWIGVIASGFMLYTYLLKLYKWIEDRISLNETHSVDNWGGL